MFKKLMALFAGIMLLIVLSASFVGKNIKQVVNINFNNITKIVFYDGRGGKIGPVTIENKEKIKEFTGYLSEYRISKENNPEKTGWIHSAVFYNNNKKEMSITFGSDLEINGEYYRVIKGSLSSEKIDKFLNSVDPAK